MKNTLKTFILLAGLTALFLFIGQALGGSGGLKIALIFAGIMNLVGYWFSDKIALAMSGAKPVSGNSAKERNSRCLDSMLSTARPPMLLQQGETPSMRQWQ